MLSCEFCKISKNTFSYRTPTVAASELASLLLFLTGKWKLHDVTRQPQSLGSFIFERLGLGYKNQLLKKRQERRLGTEGNATVFLCYHPNCHKGFIVTKTRCSLQLTQRILTFRARSLMRRTNFVASLRLLIRWQYAIGNPRLFASVGYEASFSQDSFVKTNV